MLDYIATFDVQAFLTTYGYWAILIMTFLEGETIVILAAIAAAAGHLDAPKIAICAFCGTITSDQIMFCLGRYKGDSVLSYFPRLDKKKRRIADLLHRHNTILILGFRFIYGVRNVTPIMLGLTNISHRRFLLLNIIGAAIWAVLFTAGGFYFGQAFLYAIKTVGVSLIYVALGIIGIIVLTWYATSRNKQTQDDNQEPPHDCPPTPNTESSSKLPL